MEQYEYELTIVMPCLDEAETLGTCIEKARRWLTETGVNGEIIVADNGSTDGSQAIAESLGARVADVPIRGYGSALYYGTMAARSPYVIMGDSDDSYDFSAVTPFLTKLREGYDLVMGNRWQGGIQPGAMPWKNRYLGNPILSRIGRLLFRVPAKDLHCGLRGLRKEAFKQMDLRTTGMEYASEMVIKATLLGLKICEVPTTLSKDGRSRPPHLRPWRDGWRHLRFMLLFSPRWLFMVPGALLLIVSLGVFAWLLPGPRRVGSVTLDIHTLAFAAAGMLLGYLAVLQGVVIRIFGAREGLLPTKTIFWALRKYPVLEIGATTGILMVLSGLVLGVWSLLRWQQFGFGRLDPSRMMRFVTGSVLLLLLGGITFLFSLTMGFLMLPTRRQPLQ